MERAQLDAEVAMLRAAIKMEQDGRIVDRMNAEVGVAERVQRERDRAQAIIHAASIGLPLSWGMYLGSDGNPDLKAIANDAGKVRT